MTFVLLEMREVNRDAYRWKPVVQQIKHMLRGFVFLCFRTNFSLCSSSPNYIRQHGMVVTASRIRGRRCTVFARSIPPYCGSDGCAGTRVSRRAANVQTLTLKREYESPINIATTSAVSPVRFQNYFITRTKRILST